MLVYYGLNRNLNTYKLGNLKDIKIDNKIKSKYNQSMFVNTPEVVFKQVVTSLKFISLNINPKKKIRNLGIIDYLDWNKKTDLEINRLKNFCHKNFGKNPTFIYNTGQGINILLELDNRIAKKDFNDGKFNALKLVYSTIRDFYIDNKTWELDTILDDTIHLSSQENFDVLTKEICKVPILQRITARFKGQQVIYSNKIFRVDRSDNKFNLIDIAKKLGGLHFHEPITKQIDKEILIKINKKYDKNSCIITGEKHQAILYPNGSYTCFDCGYSVEIGTVYKQIFGRDYNPKTEMINMSELHNYTESLIYKGKEVIIYFKTPISTFNISTADLFTKEGKAILQKNNIRKDRNFSYSELSINIQNKINADDIPINEIVKTGLYIDKAILNIDKNICIKNSVIGTETGIRPSFNLDGDFNSVKIDPLPFCSDYNYMVVFLSIFYDILLTASFKKTFGIAPLVFCYGLRDSGKTSLIQLVQSLFTTNIHDLNSPLLNKKETILKLKEFENLPVLFDEFTRKVKKNNVFEYIKDMSTNGDLSVVPFFVSEYRDIDLDPSIYQRSIELNLDILIENIDIKKVIEFREFLSLDKTGFLIQEVECILKNPIDWKKEIEYITSNETYNSYYKNLDGKKQLLVILHIAGIKKSWRYLNNGTDTVDYFIIKYLKSEILHNGMWERMSDLKEIIISFLQSKMKLKLSRILDRLSVYVGSKKCIIKYNSRDLISLGFSNQTILNEFKTKAGVFQISLKKDKFRTDSAINLTHKEALNFMEFIDSLLSHELPEVSNIINNIKEKLCKA